MKIDLSFICSRYCNLKCSFCMYNGGPDNNSSVDFAKLKFFISTIDKTMINSFGLYGGEIEQLRSDYDQLLQLLDPSIHRWAFSNGNWSVSKMRTYNFLAWCLDNKIGPIIISGTPEHRAYQDRKVLSRLQKDYPNFIRLKNDDERFYPMGRLAGQDLPCTQRCITDKRPIRMAYTPENEVIFQTCDGVYPILGQATEGFRNLVDKIPEAIKNCSRLR